MRAAVANVPDACAWLPHGYFSFATLEDDMNLAEDYLKFCTQFVLEHCSSDIDFFMKFKRDDGTKDEVRRTCLRCRSARAHRASCVSRY